MKVNEKKTASLAEISHGQTEVKFAFMNGETGDTITPFVKCKDFLTDVFWGNATGKAVSIYGFKWNPKEDNGILEKNRLFLAVKLVDRNTGNKKKITKVQTKQVASFLNQFDKSLKFTKSKVTLSEDENYMIIEFDRKWTELPYTVSALLMFIRLGINYTDSSKTAVEFYEKAKSTDFISPNDELYLRKIKNRVKDLFDGKVDKRQTYAQYTDGGSIHNRSGIVYYSEYKI